MPRRPSQSLSIKLLTKSVSGLSYLAPVCLRFLYLAWRLFFVVFKQLFTCKIFLRILHLRFVAIGWLGVIGLWFLGGLFILIYAVFGDTCAAIDEWTTNPRNGTAFDIIVRCELNHTKPPRGRRHASMGEVLPVAGDEDEIVFPEYNKPLSDLSLHHLLPALIPPLPKFKSPKDTTDEEETPFPEYKSFLNNESFDWNDDDDDDDPNDASPQKREFWAELAVQQNDAASENESCTILRAAFVPILETISTYNCPGILRNTLWVTLAVVVVSGGCMFSICLWIVITRRSTMRWRKMVPSADDQLPSTPTSFKTSQLPCPCQRRTTTTSMLKNTVTLTLVLVLEVEVEQTRITMQGRVARVMFMITRRRWRGVRMLREGEGKTIGGSHNFSKNEIDESMRSGGVKIGGNVST